MQASILCRASGVSGSAANVRSCRAQSSVSVIRGVGLVKGVARADGVASGGITMNWPCRLQLSRRQPDLAPGCEGDPEVAWTIHWPRGASKPNNSFPH